MKKIIMSMLLVYINIAKAQHCLYDIPRQNEYMTMDVMNWETKEYDKYTKAAGTSMAVTIVSKSRVIYFRDDINKYYKTFTIVSCAMLEDDLVYNCIDPDNKRICTLTFSNDFENYTLKVEYECKPVIYIVKRNKNTN